MDPAPTQSPEYRAIKQNKQALQEQLSICLGPVTARLGESDTLTEYQCKQVLSASNGAEVLVDIMLVGIKATPVESFMDFVEALKRCANKAFKKFVIETVERQRKSFYRGLFSVGAGVDQLSQTAYDVFISYSRDPSGGQLVETIESRLMAEGLRVFRDERSISPGVVWPVEIVNAIKTCKAFVAILSKGYVNSLYCNGELFEAEALGKAIFPVECESGWDQEPAGRSVREVVRLIQPVSMVTEATREEGLRRLVQSVKKVASSVTTPNGATAELPREPATQPSEDTDGGWSVEAQLKDYMERSKVTDADIDRCIEQSAMPLVANCVTTAIMYATTFDLSGGEVTDVRRKEHQDGVRIAMTHCLDKWKSHNSYGATYRDLLLIMLRLGNQQDAVNLLQHIASEKKRSAEIESKTKHSSEEDLEDRREQLPGMDTADRSKRRADTTEPDSDQEESLPDSLLLKHRLALEKHRETLCRDMNAHQVILQLRKHGVFTAYDQEVILNQHAANLARNGDIIDRLCQCGPQAFSAFVCSLQSVDQRHTELTLSLQPVTHRVLWFAPSPTVAAAVVHSLETYGGARFPEFPHTTPTGGVHIVRRGGVFQWMVATDNPSDDDDGSDRYDSVEDVEVCLVFPVEGKPPLVREAMIAAFRECPRPCVAVMSGACDGVSSAVCEGDIVIADSASGPSTDVTLDQTHVRTAKRAVAHLLTPPHSHWITELGSTHPLRVQGPKFSCIAMPPSAQEGELPKLACVDDQSWLACDRETYDFYKLCQTELPGGIPYYSSKGVAGSTLSCAVLSSCVAMEICKAVVENARKSRTS